jgi:hypothetical protein
LAEPQTAHAKPEPANAGAPAPAPAAGSVDASGAAGGTGASASSGSAASTLKSAQAARWPAHAAAAHAGEQKRAFRQLAHTSGVDAPQAAQGARAKTGEDMSMIISGGQRGCSEFVHVVCTCFNAPFFDTESAVSRTL